MKTQVNSLKSFSHPKIISSTIREAIQFLVIISYFTFSLLNGYGFNREVSELTLTLKEETWILHRKVTLLPMILDKFAFSFVFNLRKQNATDFSFISFTQTFCFTFKLLLLVIYQTMVAHQWLLPLPRSILNIWPHQTVIFKSR